MIGIHPNILEQAGEFVKELRAHPYFEGKKLVLAGQCHGAAIASYAALKNELPAVCFNSFILGAGSQYAIGKQKLSLADKYITHIACKGNFSTDFSLMRRTAERIADAIGIRTSGHFGRKFVIPAAYKTKNDIHTYVLGSVMAHLGYDKWAKPANITA